MTRLWGMEKPDLRKKQNFQTKDLWPSDRPPTVMKISDMIETQKRAAGLGSGACPVNETGQVDVGSPRMVQLCRGRISNFRRRLLF
jgi:hypothetical protein